MSLRTRLNLLIAACFLLVLALGLSFVIYQARYAVQEEVTSTANLTLRLIEVALSGAEIESGDAYESQQRIIRQIARLGETRHLHIEIIKQGVPLFDTRRHWRSFDESGTPRWFSKLIGATPMEFRRLLTYPDAPDTEIIVRADPSDEIAEAWLDVRIIIGMLVMAVILANILVYFTIGRGFRPIGRIIQALEGIEKGDYQRRLPRFNLPEMAQISEKFNHMAEVLERSRDENRTLTQRSLAIQERERRSLAHELHDELGQSISAIKAVAASINQQEDRRQIASSAETIVSISNDMYGVARQMMRRLRPVVLDELGLVAALQEMVDDWNSRHEDIFCHFNHDGEFDSLGEDLNISVYRIIQEGLTNISKHSGAGEVDVLLARVTDDSGDRLQLTLRDDGLGFDMNRVNWGLGLLGMRERTQALGGNFSLATQPGKGVSIEITIPLSQDV